MAKSRWEIENQIFNEAKNLYGMTPIRHHHANSLLVCWLLFLLALCVERLYRLCYLHRGGRPPLYLLFHEIEKTFPAAANSS